LKYGELKKILRKNGCKIVKEGANHEMWYSKTTSKIFPVARHNSKEVPTGTYNSIMRDAGIE